MLNTFQKPSFLRGVVLRYWLPTIIAGIPAIGGMLALVDEVAIFQKDQRCIHDHLAGTTVIKLGEPRGVLRLKKVAP